ncbi:helix-turn-helix transcriptional regulator [Salinibacterium sp. dk2585]|uniref:TetR/AcrR family transcriptional regulator n=1 Tax=unclassified Salinibacterium TaxID=2632331 RepID=UPI0011C252F1|nr:MULTISPECIES: TetR/AcrR family transcriptional regulator [unclassified Salinibacterium]QEE60993.1 helix-turn-helix transcriptional regulator [Salinibacterium sp. dk2585]TXK52935.1 helix-turn-helix transcriptional regulator [Salinibacterium sp. dk5596]
MTDTSTLVLSAAARVFASQGYLRTTLHDIAAAAGLSSDDLERQSPDKYALFAQSVLGAARTVLRASDHLVADVQDSRQARAQLAAVIEASARATIAQRDASGFYRSEVRYLLPDDRAENAAIVEEVQARIRRPLALLRPELEPVEVAMLAAASQSAVASITIHPTDMPEQKILTLLTTAAMRVLDSSPVRPSEVAPAREVHLPWRHDDSPRSRIQRAALTLFARDGFCAVAADDVAAASGVSLDVIAREFGDLSGLLREACVVGHAELQRIDNDVLSTAETPRDALIGFSCNYVHYSFEEPEGMTAFLNDGRRLPGDQKLEFLRMQAFTVGHWVRSLLGIRPELSLSEAQFLVFAGMCIVNDLGRKLDWQRDELTETRVQRVVLAAMANIRAG